MLVRTRSYAGRDGGDSLVVTCRCYRRGTWLSLTSRISSVAMTCSACICITELITC